MKKILVIDDDLNLLEAIKEALVDEVYEVIMAGDGLQALDKVVTEEPDLLLVDIKMNGIDGDLLVSQLKSKEVTKKLPIVLTSSLYDLPQRAERSGADGFIQKPYNLKDLVEVIESCNPNRS